MISNNVVNIKLFAELKELLGKSNLTLCISKASIQIQELLSDNRETYPIFSQVLRDIKTKYKIYVNGDMVTDLSIEIKPNDEIAILPPVGGG